MIRYRIKDVTMLMEGECACGRTSPRIARISGRTDDMLIVRGINVFPSQIEYTLLQIPEVGDQYMIYVSREGALDEMTIQVELRPEAFTDKLEDMLARAREMIDLIRDDETAWQILWERYIMGETWSAIARKMNYSLRTVHLVANAGLEKINERLHTIAHDCTSLHIKMC